MKTYHRPLESNGCDSGFVKSALYTLEIDDKSSFSMSGHVPYSPTDTAVASVASVSRIRRDLPRICFEQVSEYTVGALNLRRSNSASNSILCQR